MTGVMNIFNYRSVRGPDTSGTVFSSRLNTVVAAHTPFAFTDGLAVVSSRGFWASAAFESYIGTQCTFSRAT